MAKKAVPVSDGKTIRKNGKTYYSVSSPKPVSDNRHKQSSPEAIHKTRWGNYTPDTVTMNGRVRRRQNNPVSVEENRRMLEKGFVQKYSVPEPWKPTSQNRPVMKPDPRPPQRKVNDVGLKYKKKR